MSWSPTYINGKTPDKPGFFSINNTYRLLVGLGLAGFTGFAEEFPAHGLLLAVTDG